MCSYIHAVTSRVAFMSRVSLCSYIHAVVSRVSLCSYIHAVMSRVALCCLLVDDMTVRMYTVVKRYQHMTHIEQSI